ncbi:hypothetical protein PENARI_c017G12199 [Penicillium arizonense]|uniref:Carboxylesterase type B domain-containing protein n=1 Tax=Penicillium arizonense TaxID=1835702 RepID=A0A1F5LAL6_PENAI|nr:hypothetical protein PENARI_c017G12199 [Penicillium arizonense]OGE50273.1 hypothetical protein PENARI_c017G12199 [Penicillium arizonense]
MKFAVLWFAPLIAAKVISVSTQNGEIIGHDVPGSQGVVEWLGVPYAQPPVGDLRESSDCIYTPSSLVDYPNKTASFDRVFESFTTVNNHTQSEDCLTLNIWSKVSHEPLKPVYIHFYGGRWTSGTTNTKFYNGASFASSEEIIVITANYRMNIFGFPGIPNESPNPGLQDQRLAVEWVKKNIHGFGGDPDRITISGQSCGSASVDYWAYAYRDEPLVSGLISHSGTALSFPVNSAEVAASHWFNASAKAGCTSESEGDVLACMRRQDVDTIRDAAASVKVPTTNPARKAPAFQPTVDGVTVFGNYTALSAEGKFARIPYLLGHNSNEAGFYKVATYAQGSTLTDKAWDDFNMGTFFCPSNLEAADRARRHSPVWRFQYNADWENTRLYPTSGAYHGSELNMIYGESAAITGIPESEPQLLLQGVMRRAWGAFVRDPRRGLSEVGWPVYDPHGSTLVELGLDNKPSAEFVSTEDTAERCATLLAQL